MITHFYLNNSELAERQILLHREFPKLLSILTQQQVATIQQYQEWKYPVYSYSYVAKKESVFERGHIIKGRMGKVLCRVESQPSIIYLIENLTKAKAAVDVIVS